MTRRFNYTGRQRITSGHFSANVISEDPLIAAVSLNLDGLKVTPEDRIVIEPYVGNIAKRIDCGQVSAPAVPVSVDLTDLSSGGSIQFRVKVSGKDGRLTAAGDRIRLTGINEETGRRALLPVETNPTLGEQIWKIEVSESLHPKLILNSRIPSIESRLLDDPVFGGAVLLPAIRKVLEVLAETPDGDVWQQDWLEFARRWNPDTNPDHTLESDDRDEWIDTIITAFSRKQGFARRATEPMSGAA